MSTPKVSVITVCFNEKHQIEKTIKSVLECDYENLEYILIDGFSTDGTIEIIENYSNRINFWISEHDQGIYDAMNKALKHATGDWVININAGDELLSIPKTELLESNNYHAFCGCVLIEDSKLLKPKFNWKIKLFNTLPHQGLFYNQNLLNMKYDLNYKIVSDYAFNLEMYLANRTVKLSRTIVARHLNNGVSSTRASGKESYIVIKNKLGIGFFYVSQLYRKMRGLKNLIARKQIFKYVNT